MTECFYDNGMLEDGEALRYSRRDYPSMPRLSREVPTDAFAPFEEPLRNGRITLSRKRGYATTLCEALRAI